MRAVIAWWAMHIDVARGYRWGRWYRWGGYINPPLRNAIRCRTLCRRGRCISMWHGVGGYINVGVGGYINVGVGRYVNPPLHHGIVATAVDIFDHGEHAYDV